MSSIRLVIGGLVSLKTHFYVHLLYTLILLRLHIVVIARYLPLYCPIGDFVCCLDVLLGYYWLVVLSHWRLDISRCLIHFITY